MKRMKERLLIAAALLALALGGLHGGQPANRRN